MTAIGRNNMRQDVFEPLRLDPWETSLELSTGGKHADPNLMLNLPKGMELIPADSRIPHPSSDYSFHLTTPRPTGACLVS